MFGAGGCECEGCKLQCRACLREDLCLSTLPPLLDFCLCAAAGLALDAFDVDAVLLGGRVGLEVACALEACSCVSVEALDFDTAPPVFCFCETGDAVVAA